MVANRKIIFDKKDVYYKIKRCSDRGEKNGIFLYL